MRQEFRIVLIIFGFLSFYVTGISGQEKDSSLVIVFAGDIMGHDTQINGAWDADSGYYNYEPTFCYISDYLSLGTEILRPFVP